MIKLMRIVESYGAEGQLYDLGQDFAQFRRMIDGADQQIRQQYEKQIASKLVGKRVRARASRGYKQYVKDYEFDVSKITLDDYYDNFVVVAYDNTTPKPKEYFLKPGFKVQIIGPATGQPSPQKGGDPRFEKQNRIGSMPTSATQSDYQAQHQPMGLAPSLPTQTSTPLKEDDEKDNGLYDAYGVDQIEQDIKTWMPKLLLKPTSMRDFIRGLGWVKDLGRGTVVAMYDLVLPGNMMRPKVNQETIENLLAQASITPTPGQKMGTRYEIVKLEPDQKKGEWTLRIKKVMSNE
jgi:molybdopterin converting factor small subunit